jgi:hypothetical protein
MPGKEIKGRSKIANYRHGGRTGKQFGGPLTQPLVRPGVAQPGVAQPGVAQPGVGQPGVMPTRPLGLKDGGRIGFKKGTNKKNGPVRPIDLPFPTPENPVPSKKKKK